MSHDNPTATLRACREALAAMEQAEAAPQWRLTQQGNGVPGMEDCFTTQLRRGKVLQMSWDADYGFSNDDFHLDLFNDDMAELERRAQPTPGTLRGWRKLLDMCEAAMLTEDHIDYLKLCEEREGHQSVERTRHNDALAILAALADAMGVTGGAATPLHSNSVTHGDIEV